VPQRFKIAMLLPGTNRSLAMAGLDSRIRGGWQFPRKIARLGSSRHGNRFAEFVRARNPHFAGRIF